MSFTENQTPAYAPAFNGESKVLLDGQSVLPYLVNASQHRFIGLWRSPINPLLPTRPVYSVICYCGNHLKTREQAIEHYRHGCCDLLQYITIKKE